MIVEIGSKLTDQITFGKYKGSLIKDIIKEYPTYIEWALDEIDWFCLDDEAMAEFDKHLDSHYGYDNKEWWDN